MLVGKEPFHSHIVSCPGNISHITPPGHSGKNKPAITKEQRQRMEGNRQRTIEIRRKTASFQLLTARVVVLYPAQPI